MVGFCAQGWEGFHAQGLVGSCFLALVLGLGSSQGQDVLSLAFPPYIHPGLFGCLLCGLIAMVMASVGVCC